MVPLAEPDSMERGDIVASVRGLLRPRPHAPIPTRLVLDFALRHTYTSSHVLKRDTLEAIEQDKNEFYLSKYHEQDLAFAPLAANSFGQLGPEFLRFLWALADHAARNKHPVPLPVLPVFSELAPPDDRHNPQVVRFQRLRGRIFVQARLHLLTAVYEAITHRVFGKTSPLQFDAQYWDSLGTLSASSFSQSQSHLSGSSLPP